MLNHEAATDQASTPAGRIVPFGKYLLLQRVSVGGMAQVFKAIPEGANRIDQIVAIKRILPNIAEDREFIGMFIDEARIAGQLTHPNICRIYELGRVGADHYIAVLVGSRPAQGHESLQACGPAHSSSDGRVRRLARMRGAALRAQ